MCCVANANHLAILKKGVAYWNEWRNAHNEIIPDLNGINLNGENLSGINLRKANLAKSTFLAANISNADLTFADLTMSDFFEANLNNSNFTRAFLDESNFAKADLTKANFSGAYLTKANFFKAILSQAYMPDAYLIDANFTEADLSDAILIKSNLIKASFNGANLSKANLSMAQLSRANLTKANLTEAIFPDANLEAADLTEANLTHTSLTNANLTRAIFSKANLFGTCLYGAHLIESNFCDANLDGCWVYGISVWDSNFSNATQKDLIITPILEESTITVDNLEIAQFIYILLYNEKIREVIDEVTSKVVLILGRFTPLERKLVLNAIRDELRSNNLIPVLFDFKKPYNRDIIETVSTLAGMARFVIADITDAKTVIQELERIVPNLPSVPVQPILFASSDNVWAGYLHLKRKSPNLAEIFHYNSIDHLTKSLKENVIEPAGLLRTQLLMK